MLCVRRMAQVRQTMSLQPQNPAHAPEDQAENTHSSLILVSIAQISTFFFHRNTSDSEQWKKSDLTACSAFTANRKQFVRPTWHFINMRRLPCCDGVIGDTEISPTHTKTALTTTTPYGKTLSPSQVKQ